MLGMILAAIVLVLEYEIGQRVLWVETGLAAFVVGAMLRLHSANRAIEQLTR